jgi:hypothetical protein
MISLTPAAARPQRSTSSCCAPPTQPNRGPHRMLTVYICPMVANLKFGSALVGLVCIAVGCMTGNASAISGEVGRKCAALAEKAFPPKVPGIPAAGLAKGTVQDKRAYFNKCVANGGRVE